MLLWLAAVALAQDGSTLDSVEATPTMEALGVRARVSGDEDGDARLVLEVDGHPCHDLLPLGDGLWVGSAFHLRPGREVAVRVTLVDPDNAEQPSLDTQVTTRADAPVQPSGATLRVSTTGDDEADGVSAPVATLSHALELATPGSLILVEAGHYHEAVTTSRAGSEGAPITLRAQGEVVLSGADPALEAGATWQSEGDDLWSTPFSSTCEHLVADQERLYDYPSVADLLAETEGVPGGFAVESGRLWVRLPDRSDPGEHTLHAAVLDRGVLLDGAHHLVVEGLDIRHYNSVGVDVRASDEVWVRDNRITHTNGGVRVRRGSARTVVESNQISDTSVWEWPWSASKAHTAEASGVSIAGGWGTIVHDNTIQGIFNGIATGEWGNPDPDIAAEIDVYDNTILQAADDGLEPEMACVNQRWWGNRIDGVHNAVSLAPIEMGPTWILRTLVTDYQAHFLKLNNGSTGWMLVYHNTALPSDRVDDAQAMAPSVPFGGLVMRNNALVSQRYSVEYGQTSLLGTVDMDWDAHFSHHLSGGGNLLKWLDQRYATLADFSAATGLEEHGYELQATLDADGSLSEGHALLDAGVVLEGINDRWSVDAPDVGAVERGWEPEDTALPDTANPDDTSSSDIQWSENPGCGCTSAGGGGGLVLLSGLLGLALRGRRARPCRPGAAPRRRSGPARP